jgi:hypothetical protein
VPGAGFDQLAALDEARQLVFQVGARDAVARPLAQQMLQRGAAVRQLANMLDQGLRHDPLYW